MHFSFTLTNQFDGLLAHCGGGVPPSHQATTEQKNDSKNRPLDGTKWRNEWLPWTIKTLGEWDWGWSVFINQVWSKGLGRKKKMLKPARQPAVGGRATGGRGCCITSPHTVAHNRHPCHSCVCTFYTDIVGLPLCDVCTCDCVLLLLTKRWVQHIH